MGEKIRVLVAKPGLDGHDRGALIIAQALRDAGMEVIYTGLRQTPEQIVHAAIQEDVDCIGLSSLSGAHLQLFPEVTRLLKEYHAEDILVVGGGVIPDEDIPILKEHGIAAIFTPGSSLEEVISFIREEVAKKRKGMKESIPPSNLDHIGIAVRSIEQALSFYEALGLSVERIEEVPSEQVRVAMLPVGNTRLELLEATTSESTVAKFIEKRGEGIHHIALQVANLEEYLLQMKRKGITPIPPEIRAGAHGSKVSFISPKVSHGILYELVQPGEKDDEE